MKKELGIKLFKNSLYIILMILSLIIYKNTGVALIHPIMCSIGIFIFSIIFIYHFSKIEST